MSYEQEHQLRAKAKYREKRISRSERVRVYPQSRLGTMLKGIPERKCGEGHIKPDVSARTLKFTRQGLEKE